MATTWYSPSISWAVMPQCLCTWCSCNFPLPAEMLPNLKGLPFHQCLPFLAQQLCPTNIILFLSTCHTLSSIIGWLFSHSIMSNSCDPMDHNPPGTSVHEISQTRIMEQAAISFSKGSSRRGDQTHISYTGRWILYCWATREAHSVLG